MTDREQQRREAAEYSVEKWDSEPTRNEIEQRDAEYFMRRGFSILSRMFAEGFCCGSRWADEHPDPELVKRIRRERDAEIVRWLRTDGRYLTDAQRAPCGLFKPPLLMAADRIERGECEER